MPELCPQRSLFFESLKSQRRLNLLCEVNAAVVQGAKGVLPDLLKVFPCLQQYEVFASDFHFIAHACHDHRDEEGRAFAVGHVYTRSLRHGTVQHLTLGDQSMRRKEHDMRALKRLDRQVLRAGTRVGKKVLHVYDRAGIDVLQWMKWK
jgi:hypothetical protein